jgi:hypothetical protein
MISVIKRKFKLNRQWRGICRWLAGQDKAGLIVVPCYADDQFSGAVVNIRMYGRIEHYAYIEFLHHAFEHGFVFEKRTALKTYIGGKFAHVACVALCYSFVHAHDMINVGFNFFHGQLFLVDERNTTNIKPNRGFYKTRY